ncbi:MAG: hypothetical protein WCC63_04695 [Candidatus Bathyarchaeia archaeon]
MGKTVTVSAKVPEDVYSEFALRVPDGERSIFIRDAIMEKLQATPRSDKLLELKKRVDTVETNLSEIRKYLASLEVLTYDRGKINPYTFCVDETDHQIIDYLLQHKGATTPELAEQLRTNRWLVLNRLRRIQKSSRKQLGKPIVQHHSGEKNGKKKAWWLSEELTDT